MTLDLDKIYRNTSVIKAIKICGINFFIMVTEITPHLLQKYIYNIHKKVYTYDSCK